MGHRGAHSPHEAACATLKGRSLLTLRDLSDREMLDLLAFASELKRERLATGGGNRLSGRQVGMLFEKASTRTRCATAVAVTDEGGHVQYLASGDVHLGKKESVADTARVLGRYLDGIMFRGYEQETVRLLAKHSGVPVWNGLTDQSHPTQALADLMTMLESFGSLQGLKLAYVGDGRNNVVHSLMIGCAKAGVHVFNCTPPELQPDPAVVQTAMEAAARNGSTVTVLHDPVEAVRDAHAVYTDVWVSMGEESRFRERLRLLRPYQVTMDLMRRTGHLESGRVIFMHCLPAFHNDQTRLTRKSGALEVTDEVFEGPFSRVFDQAENRMHTIKAVIAAALAR